MVRHDAISPPPWFPGYQPQWVVKDESYGFVEAKMPNATPIKSKIRVTFNRSWTWSEREEFREDVVLYNEIPENGEEIFSEGFTQSGTVLTISGNYPSRELYRRIALYCERYLVNVHPTAVLTVFPKEVM